MSTIVSVFVSLKNFKNQKHFWVVEFLSWYSNSIKSPELYKNTRRDIYFNPESDLTECVRNKNDLRPQDQSWSISRYMKNCRLSKPGLLSVTAASRHSNIPATVSPTNHWETLAANLRFHLRIFTTDQISVRQLNVWNISTTDSDRVCVSGFSTTDSSCQSKMCSFWPILKISFLHKHRLIVDNICVIIPI